MTTAQFAAAVESLGREFGGSVTSWGRTDTHAVQVGGFAGDPHTWWLGADLVWDAPPITVRLVAEAARLGLKALVEKTHTHVQPADFPAGPVKEYTP